MFTKEEGHAYMVKAVEWFLWGLCMGAGWLCAQGLINLILQILQSHH